MDIWENQCIGESTREFVLAFMTEAVHGTTYADALADSFDTHLSYVPEESIGWEITLVLDSASSVYVSRRVADLMTLGDGWFDELMGAVEDARALVPGMR